MTEQNRLKESPVRLPNTLGENLIGLIEESLTDQNFNDRKRLVRLLREEEADFFNFIDLLAYMGSRVGSIKSPEGVVKGAAFAHETLKGLGIPKVTLDTVRTTMAQWLSGHSFLVVNDRGNLDSMSLDFKLGVTTYCMLKEEQWFGDQMRKMTRRR